MTVALPANGDSALLVDVGFDVDVPFV